MITHLKHIFLTTMCDIKCKYIARMYAGTVTCRHCSWSIIVHTVVGRSALNVLSYTSSRVTRTHPPTTITVQCTHSHPTMMKLTPPFRRFHWRWMAGRCFIQINCRICDAVFAIVLGVFAYKQILGRTETQTCDRMCSQSIRTVWDISRDDRAIIATCSLLTPTDLSRILV